MYLLRILILCLIWASVAQPVNSQVTVTPSKTKTVIDGKTYYLHTIKQGETLYSISKAYNIPQKDVVFNNPDAFEGIRVGQVLRIPVKTEDTPTSNKLESAQFIYHIAEKGQTAYGITQLYGITDKELYKYNPELEHSLLQAGQVVTIPKTDKGATAQHGKPKTGYIIHTVKRKETLFSIAKSYDADLNRIFEINPEIDLAEPKIKTGQEIKIPMPDAEPINLPIETSGADTIIIRQDLMNIPATSDQIADTTAKMHIPDLPPVTNDSINCVPTDRKEFRIALLLPLYLAENYPASAPDSALVKDSEGRFRYKNGRYWMYRRSVNALEFYEGALLAVDSLKNRGLNAKVVVFDTMRDTVKMAQLLNSPAMKEMDLIIGPFYTELIDQTARFARENKIYYVSPIAVNANSLKNNPYLMQINAGEINAVGPVVDYISKRENVQVTLIGNKSETDQMLFEAYRNKLKTIFPDSCLTVCAFRPDSLQPPGRYLKRQKLNVVIITAVDEAFFNVLAGQLNAAAHSHNINLFGSASRTKFVNLDAEYLYSLEFRYPSAFYVDNTKPEVQQFLRKYRKTYYTEPTMLTGRGSISPYPYQFAFLGYDAVFYFASAMKMYGKGFGFCIPNFRQPGLQSDFRFYKVNPFGGYLNTHLDIYKYTKDYTVVKESATEETKK